MTDEGDQTAGAEMIQSGPASEIPGSAPEFTYFYYIRKKPKHSGAVDDLDHDDWDLRAFVEMRKSADDLDEQEIKELMTAADAGELHLRGTTMEEVVLKHRAYMLFVWEEAGRILKNVRFIFRDDPDLEHQNFAEFSSTTLCKDVSVVSCVNTRKDRYGGPLGNKSEKFDVIFDTNPELPKGIHNENTTNTGP